VLRGVIKDSTDGETLIGATVYVTETGQGTVTNAYGFYSLSIPAGTYNLRISYLGYETMEVRITIEGNISRNFDLRPSSLALEEVVVICPQKGS
jgi:hypothetical protein